MKLYVASSWRNGYYSTVVSILEANNHSVLDWRVNGFSWDDVEPNRHMQRDPYIYRDSILTHDRAKQGFNNDYSKMKDADACVLLLPCGKSAHLEAGWFVGRNKPLHIYIPKKEFKEPELMYKFADSINFNTKELLQSLHP